MRDHKQNYDPESQLPRDCSMSGDQRHEAGSESPADESQVSLARAFCGQATGSE
ncbi:MAG: hypothetical protein O2983_11615 [Planctomycetota bacterium]|nr:hypothetical protein [Planctomycetota bacterium]